MIEKLQPFMTVDDAIEVMLNPHHVPDAQLKLEIITLLFNGADEQIVWDYINTWDE